MKYALNHPWKFDSWSSAVRIGLMQMTVVLSLEMVNLLFMLSNTTIADIVKDFLALVIISDFDDYFFMSVTHTMVGRFIVKREVELGGRTL